MSEPVDEVHQALSNAVRTAVTAAGQVAAIIARRRAEEHRRAQYASEAEARQSGARMRAEREAAMPVIRQNWNEKWWRSAIPKRIAETYQVTAGWAGVGDPLAQASLHHLREQIATRYGVTLPPGRVEAGGLAELLAHGRSTGPARGGQDERAHPEGFPETPDVPYRYTIRDLRSPQAEPHRGTGRAGEAVPVELFAAEQLLAFPGQEAREDRQRAPVEALVIDVYPAEVGPRADPVFTLTGDRAEAVHAAARDQHRRILAGEDTGASHPQIRAALRTERQRVWEQVTGHEKAAHQASRAALRDGGEGGPEVALREEKVTQARERLGGLNLRLRAVEADMRGEDGTVVTAAAALHATLDEQWWATANAEEIGGVWDHVAGWSDGADKTATTTWLQANIHRLYGADPNRKTSGEAVSAAVNAALAYRNNTEAQRLRGQASEEDASAEQAQSTAARFDQIQAPLPGGAQSAQGERMRAAADQDRAAAATLEGMADRAAAAAVGTAAEAFPQTPSVRLAKAVKTRRSSGRAPKVASRQRESERGR